MCVCVCVLKAFTKRSSRQLHLSSSFTNLPCAFSREPTWHSRTLAVTDVWCQGILPDKIIQLDDTQQHKSPLASQFSNYSKLSISRKTIWMLSKV